MVAGAVVGAAGAGRRANAGTHPLKAVLIASRAWLSCCRSRGGPPLGRTRQAIPAPGVALARSPLEHRERLLPVLGRRRDDGGPLLAQPHVGEQAIDSLKRGTER